MYILLLLLAATFLISIFTTNWPVKFYHHYLLKQLAELLGAIPEKNGLLSSSVYSQINTIYRDKELKIRFVEASVDSIKEHSGLEIRMYINVSAQGVLECYPMRKGKHEWGDFKRFLTGDPGLDRQWFILTNEPVAAGVIWDSCRFPDLLRYPGLEKLLINQNELIVQFKYYYWSAEKVKQFIDQLVHVC
ncbi:MAG TPA: hypothetical protein DDW65_21055 [Firmicutes bacterium]|nr:hypothetical protein [Bacillota bacterium]